MEFQEFRVGDYFECEYGDTDIQRKHLNGKGHVVITAGSTDSGIAGKTDIPAKIFEKNTITIDMFGQVNYRNFDYKLVTHGRIFSMKPCDTLSENVMLYITTVIQYFKKEFSYTNGISAKIAKERYITLPSKNNQPDWEYMEKYIEECKTEYVNLETEHVNLEYKTAYQFLNGANPAADPGEPQEGYQDFRVGDILNKRTSLIAGNKIQTSKIKTDEFDLPATSAQITNNSLAYYVDSTKHEALNNMLVITSNGAAGFISYHNQPFAIAQDSYAMEIIDEAQRKENIYLYLKTVLSKITIQTYSYTNKAIWARVQNLTILLPSKNNQPDWEYMDSYIEFIKNGQSDDPDKQSVLQQMKLQNEKHIKELENLIN